MPAFFYEDIRRMQQDTAKQDTGSWTAFLMVAFGVVGLVGAYATYAAQIPFDRAMARNTTIDQAVAASHGPNPKAAEAALRPLLGDSADRLLDGPGDIEARAATERSRMLVDLHAESVDYGVRLRVVIAAFTAAAALFGAMVPEYCQTVMGEPLAPEASKHPVLASRDVLRPPAS